MNKREVGNQYEQVAKVYLEGLGYQVVEQNFRCKIGEIDLIALQDGYLVFVEVKYRKNHRLGTPMEAVNVRKQRTISRVATYYCLKYHSGKEPACRFDIVWIEGKQMQVIANAFDYID